jgi:excisionase family DNA binding protein
MTTARLPIPSPEAAEEAKLALRTLSPAGRNSTARTVRVRAGDEDAIVPREAFELLLEILGQMANGNAVTLVPVQAEFTTQQAADFLNVSRPFVIQLLEAGAVPFRKVGTHRRVRFEDLLAYKEADDARRKRTLEQLAAEAQQHDMGY